jgi:Fe-S-cluster containining protein
MSAKTANRPDENEEYARDADGYCSHLDRKTYRCLIWEDRPERCRNYDCRKDSNIWHDWGKEIINTDVFNHLPKK